MKKLFLQLQLVNTLTYEDQSWRGILSVRGCSCAVYVIFVLLQPDKILWTEFIKINHHKALRNSTIGNRGVPRGQTNTDVVKLIVIFRMRTPLEVEILVTAMFRFCVSYK